MVRIVLYIFLAAIAGFIIFITYEKFSLDRKNKRKIKEKWGEDPQNKYTENDFKSIESYFENRTKEKGFYIDDITWRDLDMNRVFSRINNTQTSIGEEYLYNILREIIYDKKILESRNELIEYFRKHPAEREKLQILLSKQGKLRFLNISDYISGKRSGFGESGLIYKVLAVIFIALPFLAAKFPVLIVLFLASLVTNVTIYFKARDRIIGHLQSLSYIVNMVNTAKHIARLSFKEIDTYTARLRKSSGRVKGISLSIFYSIFYTSENYIVELVKIFFLGEPIAFHSIFKLIDKYREELEDIFQCMGELDSLISAASYRESLEYFTAPDLSMGIASHKFIEFTDMVHPLIENPVANSFKAEKAVLVTGSNASGKSTFLKSVAINAILAQTIYTCLAREYHSTYFKIYSSMALNDNLEAKESYYIVEIKSLKRIIEGLNDGIPCLCVIDEVLRGTNTIERISASSEIIHFIANSNCICLCATHDIELTHILNSSVDNYHFQEFFTEGKIAFDYKIYSGEATTRNAIKLLEILGYDEKITSNAEKRAQTFLGSGHWDRLV